MKTKILLAAVLCCGLFTASAQTNVPPSLLGGLGQIGQAFETASNWVAETSYGRSSDYNLAFAGIAYNFNNNVGLIVGDEIIFGNGKPQISTVAGGVTLSGQLRPLAFLGGNGWASKLTGTVYAADLIATPRNGNAIGNLAITGISFDVFSVSNFEGKIGAGVEKRMGQGKYDGTYALFTFGIGRKF